MAPQLLSLECWGGATYDVALRFLAEDPWERLAALREAVPNICTQMLLRGRNTVGYTPYPTEVTDAFVAEAAATGMDIFRIFDALNDVAQMRPAIEAVRATGTALAEVALCYTGDLSDPAEPLYTLDYYLRLAEQIVEAGAHVLAIKDMAGLLRPPAASDAGHRAAGTLRPAGAPAHPRHGGRAAGHPDRGDRRRSRRRRRGRRLDGGHDEPALAVRPGRGHRPHRPGHRPVSAGRRRPRALLGGRTQGLPRRSSPGSASPTGRVYHHEIPGGQLSNLRQQAIALGLGDRFELIEDCYAAADRMLGRLVKVTPSSKVVGDLALHLVGAGVEASDFESDPGQVRPAGLGDRIPARELGDPPGGWPEPFRTRALEGRPAQAQPPQLSDEDRRGLRDAPRTTLNRLLFPGPTKAFDTHREAYGDTSVLSTQDFFYGLEPDTEHTVTLEQGVTLLIELEAISEADERGYPQRAGHASTGSFGRCRCATPRSSPTSRPPRRPSAATTAMSPRRSPVSSPCRSRKGRPSMPGRPSPPSRP